MPLVVGKFKRDILSRLWFWVMCFCVETVSKPIARSGFDVSGLGLYTQATLKFPKLR
ncbi:MAG: hypothetical protein LBJ00_11645 [Planctomycetaceae bacterium]|nr:hypothetical protein [Planctomycetaceae bacterium]